MTRSHALITAAALRVPIFRPGTHRQAKLDSLEEYMLVSAYWLGECHEERLSDYEALRGKESEWDQLQGWEAFRRGKTDSSIDEAKKVVRPDLWAEITDGRWHVARLTDEIERLDRDATKVSRVYSIITGT